MAAIEQYPIDANKGIFRLWFGEAWNKGNFEVAHLVVDEGFVVHGAGGQPIPSGVEGVKQLIRVWRSAFPDGQMSVDDLVAEGEYVVARTTWRGTHQGEFYGIPPTGKRVAVTSLGIDRILHGKIVAGWGELDMVGMMQQMGALPMVGPGAVAKGKSPEWSSPKLDLNYFNLSPDQNRALGLRFVHAFNSGREEEFAGLIDSAEYVEHAPIWGTDNYPSSMKLLSTLRAAMPDLRYQYDQDMLFSEGDLVNVHGLVTGTHTGADLFGVPASGKKIIWSQTDLLRIAGGKIVERWACADTLALMQQAGVVPS